MMLSIAIINEKLNAKMDVTNSSNKRTKLSENKHIPVNLVTIVAIIS